MKPSLKRALAARKVDGVFWLHDQLMEGIGDDPFLKADSIKKLAEALMLIENVTIRDKYQQQLTTEKKIRRKDFSHAFQSLEGEKKQKRDNHISSRSTRADDYELPSEVEASGGSFDKYESDIVNYGLFTHLNVIYIVKNADSEGKKYFKSYSNFSIEIINHMEDEKISMRLVRIRNTSGREKIFDTQFDSFLTKNSFLKMVEAYGNFQFDGSEKEYLRLKAKLMDEMGDGRKIDVLGWQDDGFWAFNNCIVYDDEIMDLDENGMIEVDGVCYYIPSGNSIYKRNPTKFLNQKKVTLDHCDESLEWLLQQCFKVHRERFFHAILFAIAGSFRDMIHQQLSFFPILFMSGKASTGKDNLVEFIQAFFGHPQEALVMTGRDNTAKAKIRELAQFQNMPAHFSEYKEEPETDDMIKKLWDGRGYKRGTIDSAFGNEVVPVRCPIVITSNYYPSDDPVITRLVAMEFFNTGFTQEEVNEYDLLKECIKRGISGFLPRILKLRGDFEKNFRNTFKSVVAEIKKDSRVPSSLAPRMIQNVAVLGAAYKLAEKEIPFPFTWDEWMTFCVDSLKKQEEKRSTGGMINRFFDVLMDLIRDKHDPIEPERHFRVAGNELSIRFSMIYSRYNKQHFTVYRTQGLSKAVLSDHLKNADSFIEEKNTIRFGPDSRSSGMVFDLDKLHIKEDLLEELQHIMNARSGSRPIQTPAPTSSGDDEKDGNVF